MTEIQVSHNIALTSYNDLPGSSATPDGTLIVSQGNVDSCVWCVFFFLDFFELSTTDMPVEGTTDSVSLVVFRCRVRGAMLVWQDDGRGKTWKEGMKMVFWKGETSSGMGSCPGACGVFIYIYFWTILNRLDSVTYLYPR